MKFYDLSHGITHQMPVWPGSTAEGVIVNATFETAGWTDTVLLLGTHTGTHIDAPFHMIPAGRKVDEIDLEKCVGNALVVDLKSKKPNEEIRVSDLEKFATRIEAIKRVIIRTDWSDRFESQEYYASWPYVSPATARWLVDRGIKLLGVDTPSPPSADPKMEHEVHEILLSRDVVIVENLTNLSKLTKSEIYFVALPLKIVGREASPVRAVAIEE